jgi:RNA polymerase sigma-70 factor (ECF subfamily)
MDEKPDEITAAALRARRGDRAAATAFVHATQSDVWRLCVNLGSRSNAADLAQETYARAFASLHRFAGRSSARTWLLSIARRVCADEVRAAVRERATHASEVQHADQARYAGDHADAVVLQTMLDTLDPERREAFVLTQLVGLSYAETADVCNCPVGTIRSRVARARADLVSAFGSDHRRTGNA